MMIRPLMPLITCREHVVTMMKLNHAMIVATDDLLKEAGMEEKRVEEQGHAEWLATDLHAMGESPYLIDYDAACLAGAQYYYIRHIDPRMLLGYCAALECQPMPLNDVEQLEALYGEMPTLRYHATHDVVHGPAVLAQIHAISSETLRNQIWYNASCTVAYIARILHARFAWCTVAPTTLQEVTRS